MLELSRFQMLRSAQRISEEEKSQLGLALYGEQGPSPFAKQLLNSADAEEYASIVQRFAGRKKGAELVTNKAPHPDLLALSNWLGFKAQPIRAKDLEAFVGGWTPAGSLNLKKEWQRIADNYVVALLNPQLNLGCRYDFQLLIRAL